MKLKDITKEQAIEIAKILSNGDELIGTEFEFIYQPYDPSWYEDAREYVRVSWFGKLFINGGSARLIMEIDKDFNVYYYYRTEKGLSNLGLRDQQKIHRKLIKWNCEPDNITLDELRDDKFDSLGI